MLVLFRSFSLSNGYVIATIGAIIVKNAIYITLFIYLIANIAVKTTSATYIIKYAILVSYIAFEVNL